MLDHGFLPDSKARRHRPPQEPTTAWCRSVGAWSHDNLAPGDDGLRPGVDSHGFVRRVADSIVEVGVGDPAGSLVPYDQVGVRADCQRALLRIQAGCLGRSGGDHLHKIGDAHPATGHSSRVGHGGADFDPRQAVGDPGERGIGTVWKLLRLGVRRMIRCGDMDLTIDKKLNQLDALGRTPKWRVAPRSP